MNRVKIFASIFFFSCTLLGYVQGQNTNNLCLNANPFCTDENPYGVTFPAGTDATATPDLPQAQGRPPCMVCDAN